MFKVYTHASFLKHDTGPGHPERADRLRAVLPLFGQYDVVQARQAAWEEIARAHDERYMEAVQALIPDQGYAWADNDTVVSPGSWDAALHAAGAVCQAVDDVLSGNVQKAFCAVRPPGHHAFPGHAEGFCLFNNIAIGALQARHKHGLARVAIADFDVHHGNGTDAMARKHEGIFFASSHQGGIYPGSGWPQDDIKGRIVNVPLQAGAGSPEFQAAWRDKILPQIDAFAPELLMISAGFDAHRDDPLAQLELVEDDFRWVTEELVGLADKHSGGRIVSVLEGGYDLEALKRSVKTHLGAFASEDHPYRISIV